ncbi:MAG: cytochrome c oxidase subunit II [Proteobacteria bacterium]|nr:cytochrome c oxidase subunit II [Pseudomonadota bacterium]
MTALSFFGAAGNAFAGGRSEPWQMWFQPAASPVMERIIEFHNLLFVIEVSIVTLVLGLMCYIIVRFNAKANPVPTKTTHNTLLEVVWTGVPLLILMVIAVPSLNLLYYADRIENIEMTLKVTGNQWFWTYSYPDHGGFEFDSVIVPDDELKEGQPRLLTVDNEVVLPVETNIRLLFTSSDVIHNWAVPSLGLKLDTVAGRINENWMRINKEGDYYGMCSELCGINHGFMPIHVKAVSKADFAEWVETARKEFAGAGGPAPVRVAETGAR